MKKKHERTSDTHSVLQRKNAFAGALSVRRNSFNSGEPSALDLIMNHQPRFRHDFSKVRVHPQPELTNHQLPPDMPEEMRPSADEDPLTDYQSLTCKNGGAQSACDPDTGTYFMVRNDNTCCTRGCSAAHEAVHKKDADAWGCCKALGVAVKANPGNKKELIKKYATWRATVTPITECNAYTNDVTCADALAKTKDCSDKGKDTDCCKDIADYKATFGAMKQAYCPTAPKTVPPCPV